MRADRRPPRPLHAAPARCAARTDDRSVRPAPRPRREHAERVTPGRSASRPRLACEPLHRRMRSAPSERIQHQPVSPTAVDDAQHGAPDAQAARVDHARSTRDDSRSTRDASSGRARRPAGAAAARRAGAVRAATAASAARSSTNRLAARAAPRRRRGGQLRGSGAAAADVVRRGASTDGLGRQRLGASDQRCPPTAEQRRPATSAVGRRRPHRRSAGARHVADRASLVEHLPPGRRPPGVGPPPAGRPDRDGPVGRRGQAGAGGARGSPVTHAGKRRRPAGGRVRARYFAGRPIVAAAQRLRCRATYAAAAGGVRERRSPPRRGSGRHVLFWLVALS